jgi:hypothetical protein
MQRSHDKGSFLLFLALGYFCIINADAPYFFNLESYFCPISDFFKPCPSRAKAGFKKSPSG